MKHSIASILLLGFLLALVVPAFGATPEANGQLTISPESPSFFYSELQKHIVGDWQNKGELFTTLVKEKRFKTVFLFVLVLIPALYLLHYIFVGAKEFAHDGKQILFFGIFTRIVHWIGAISFSFLVLTGLLVIFGSVVGGGDFVRMGRYVHIGSAMVFGPVAFFLFLIWVKDMFPMPYDILWFLQMGGYLSKEKKPVPAGKFNGGQKTWFWCATVGGGVMAYTGYIMWGFGAELDMVRIYAIIHNCLAAVMIAFFLTHLYMSLFAIKGSLTSMKTGYKPQEEVDILHSKYKYK